MDIFYKTRPFYPDEQRVLRTLKSRKEKEREEGGKIKFHHFLVAGALAAGCGYLASITQSGVLQFLFGLITFVAASFIVLTPYTIFQRKKRCKEFLAALNDLIDSGTVATCQIMAGRIAIGEEYEDEGDLFIIEIDQDHILFLWDFDYTLHKKLPCSEFEIYEKKFTSLLGRMIYSSGKRIKPLIIEKKAKWRYMGKEGSPGHLEIRKEGFDKFVNAMGGE